MPDPTRQEWLLRFIAGIPRYDGPVDVIRIMKGLFLFQVENTPPPAVNYAFRPYDYGPFTPEIYRDAETLGALGYVAPSANGKAYRITDAGKNYLSTLVFPRKAEDSLIGLRIEVDDLSFRDLLRRVYSRHPESARRSIAKDILGDISPRHP